MDTYKKLFSYVPEKIHCVYITIVTSVLAAFLSIAPFWYLWKFLVELIVSVNLSGGTEYAIVIVGLMLAYAAMYFFALKSSHILAFRLESNLRKAGVDHLMNASFAFFDMNASGRIRKIIDDNASQTHMIVAHLIPDMTIAMLTPVLMFAVVFTVDWKLGALMLIVTMIGMWQLQKMTGEQVFLEKYTAALERMNSEAVEYVRGMPVIKIFRATIYSFKAFHRAITDYSTCAYDYSYSMRVPYVSFQVMFNIFICVVAPLIVLANGFGYSQSELLAKTIFYASFGSMLFTAMLRIMYVSMYQYQARQAVDALEALFDDMKRGALQRRSGDAAINTLGDNSIEFCDVSFRYEEDYVLRNLSFRLEGGKTYALVGSSGGGKSTIAKLMSGFYRIEGGEIRLGGQPIESYDGETLMKSVAFVFQHAKLFKASIFENVKTGRPDASDEEVLEALHLAQCDDILDKFEKREHTIIGSKGVYLSGGETQRIAIARAILKNAAIVILDEASAAADPENEYEIQKAFSNLMKGKTVVMIAHRLSSIRKVDEILVIDDGKVVERGSDPELTALGGRYKYLQDLFAQANSWRL